MRNRLHFLLLNIGHFLDHLVMLVFATASALVLAREWNMSYAELIPYATPGFVAFGLLALPAGRIADRWSREGMMAVYFLGAGVAMMLTSLATSPLQMAAGLLATGVFAAIYHPVGLALVAERAKGMGLAIAANGVWGNLGVGSAALITGAFIEHGGWRAAFFWPGVVSVLAGFAYLWVTWPEIRSGAARRAASGAATSNDARGMEQSLATRDLLKRVTLLVIFTSALAALLFQSTTFALPKIFDERLAGLAEGRAAMIGWLAFLVFAVASFAQLIVGVLLDRLGPRPVFIGVAALQVVFFAAMPGLENWAAFAAALGFMLGAFGQIPINDFIIGRLATSDQRATIYGARFLISFSVLAAALPFIAWVHHNWGFDTLFRVLALASAAILAAAFMLPRHLPEPASRG